MAHPENLEVTQAAANHSSDQYKPILRAADIDILKLAGESHHLIYQYLRVAASKIARTDAFYVGFYVGESIMVYPYSYDGKEYYAPNKYNVPPDGHNAWVYNNALPYCFQDDNGALLHRGKKFGQTHKRSEDAIVVPIIDRKVKKAPEVIGVLSMQSYEPMSYNADVVGALEWLANTLVLVLQREREDTARRESLGLDESAITEPIHRPSNIVNQMLAKMDSIRRKSDTVRGLVTEPSQALSDAVEALCQDCYRCQTETIELFLPAVLTRNTPFDLLSDQERKIVALLIDGFAQDKQHGYSNADIASKLCIAESTVRTHLKSIYKKYSVSGRTGIVQLATHHRSK